ncbi:MAG: amino acid ABC transporter permease [Thermoleophilia bacterium]
MGTIKDLFFSWDAVRPVLGDLLRGFWVTIELTFLSLILAVSAGLILSVMRQTRTARPSLPKRIGTGVLRVLAVVYIDVFRGLPALLVIIMLYVSLPFTGIPVFKDFTGFQVAILGLTLVYAAYLAEIFRAGIEAVERGQVEAARSLGMSNTQSLRKVVLPQAVRRVIPPLLNEFIILSKDTSLAGVIVVGEVVYVARTSQAVTLNSTALTGAAVLFLVVTLPLIRVVDRYIERDRRRRGGGRVVIR